MRLNWLTSNDGVKPSRRNLSFNCHAAAKNSFNASFTFGGAAGKDFCTSLFEISLDNSYACFASFEVHVILSSCTESKKSSKIVQKLSVVAALLADNFLSAPLFLLVLFLLLLLPSTPG